jgi:hypothetical protein
VNLFELDTNNRGYIELISIDDDCISVEEILKQKKRMRNRQRNKQAVMTVEDSNITGLLDNDMSKIKREVSKDELVYKSGNYDDEDPINK